MSLRRPTLTKCEHQHHVGWGPGLNKERGSWESNECQRSSLPAIWLCVLCVWPVTWCARCHASQAAMDPVPVIKPSSLTLFLVRHLVTALRKWPNTHALRKQTRSPLGKSWESWRKRTSIWWWLHTHNIGNLSNFILYVEFTECQSQIRRVFKQSIRK